MPRTVSDIMTANPVVLEDWENLLDVAQDMKRYSFRHLPVVESGKLVGLISHRDLLRCTASAIDPNIARDEKDHRLKERTFVRHVMTSDVETVSPDTPVTAAVNKLLVGRFGCLPVVDGDGTLVGIISEVDLLKLLTSLLESESEQWRAAARVVRLDPSIVNRDDDVLGS